MTGLLTPAAVSYDQATAGASRARSVAVGFTDITGRLTAQRHDTLTVTEASEVMEAVEMAARLATDAERAAAHAVDLGARTPPPEGRDPELERWELIVAFHESGHAEYAAQSPLMVPMSMEMDTKRQFLMGVRACGLTKVRFTKDPQRWNKRDCVDDAACSLAGPTAEALWLHRVEGAGFTAALHHSYVTGGASDYEAAMDSVGGNPSAMRKAARWAYTVVTDRWPQVVALAEILRLQEKASRGEIRRAA